MEITRLRQEYHREICRQIAYLDAQGVPNIADRSSSSSSWIARALFEQLPYPCIQSPVSGQTAGRIFEILTRSFLEQAFALLYPIRPGSWFFSTTDISAFEQYAHLVSGKRLRDISDLPFDLAI